MSSNGSDDGKPAAQSAAHENTKLPVPSQPFQPTGNPSGAQYFKPYHGAPSEKPLNSAANSTWSVESLADNLETLGNVFSGKNTSNNTEKLTPLGSMEKRTNPMAQVSLATEKQTKQSDGKPSSSVVKNAQAGLSTKNLPMQEPTQARAAANSHTTSTIRATTGPNVHLHVASPTSSPIRHGNAKKRRITKEDVLNAYNAGIGAWNPSAEQLENMIRKHEQRMLQKLDDDSEQQDRNRKKTEKRSSDQKDGSSKNDQDDRNERSASGQKPANATKFQLPVIVPPNPMFTTIFLAPNPHSFAFPFQHGNPLFPQFMSANLYSFPGQAPGLPSISLATKAKNATSRGKSRKQPVDVVDLTADDPVDEPEKPPSKLPVADEPTKAATQGQAHKSLQQAEKEQAAATVHKVKVPNSVPAQKKALVVPSKSTKIKKSRPKSSLPIEFSSEIGVIPRRPGYASRTLVELQDATKKWYERNIASKESKAAPTKIFTLYFNELSVAAVSRWASGGPIQKKQKSSSKTQNENTPSVLKRPTVDTRYRMCGICSLYGHYEIECPRLSKTQISQFGNALRPHATGKDSTAFSLEDNKLYDVVTEVCEGFIVEQRSSAYSLLTSESSGQTITKTELDGFVIEAGRMEDFFPVSEKKGSTAIAPAKATTKIAKEKTLEVRDLVAWYLTATTPESDPQCQDVCIGIISDFKDDVALIHVLKSIPFDDKQEIQEDGTRIPSPDSMCWVHKMFLYLV